MTQAYLQELITKFANGQASAAEMQELKDWYQSIHSVDIVEWPAVMPGEKERIQKKLLQGLELKIKEQRSQAGGFGRIYSIPWIKVAACLVLIACAWALGRRLHTWKEPDISIYNPSGKIQFLRLPDGSGVWLNAASSLRYPKDFSARRVIYLEGEAYFEVKEDRSHPFVVHSGALNTTVLGTSFDIRSFGAEQNNSIAVIRGKVKVENAGRPLGILTAASQLKWDVSNQKWQTTAADTSQVLAWQQGKLRYQGETMQEITGSLGRWYGVRFEFTDPAMAKCRYYLNFENTIPLKYLLQTMSVMNEMQFRIDQQTHIVTLSGKGCP